MEQITKKIVQLNWLKWLPLTGNFFFLILFCVLVLKHGRISKEFGNGFEPYVMLHWFDFFTGAGYITLLVSIVCSFFIKNRWLKWLSVLTGIITFVIIFQNVGQFNPW
jgi:hypothetical protein